MTPFPRFARTRPLALFVLLIAGTGLVRAQFRDDFNGAPIDGWFVLTGDGNARMDLVPQDGFARFAIDATGDHTNVWWTLIKRDVTTALDLAKLQDPAYELRVEARVRASHAPRRVNFMLNTSRTTNFHEHLREYDIPDTDHWHTISFTTRSFAVQPGDAVFVQLAATDWGPDRYHLDVDYYRADVVRAADAGPDLGEPLIYHPEIPDPATFAHHPAVTHDAVVNANFPTVNFDDWHVRGPEGDARILTLNADQWAVLRWDFGALAGKRAAGAGLLELTTYEVATGGNYIAAYGEDLGVEFGPIRVFEILGGDPAWDQETVTYESLLQGGTVADVFNSQMVIDLPLAEARGDKAYFTLPRPVMQRLLDGTTKGLMLRPLGALVPSIYASEQAHGADAPRLHFTTGNQ